MNMNYKKRLQTQLNVYWRIANYQDVNMLERQHYLGMYQKTLATYQELLSLEALDSEI